MKIRTLLLFCLLSLFVHVSCKKKTADKYILVNGIVLNEQTQKPITGVHVSLNQSTGSSSLGSGSSWNSIATATTDDSGSYSFYVKVGTAAGWKVDINSEPYDSKYFITWFTVNPDKEFSQVTYLSRNATLTVKAVTTNPLGTNDYIYINLPGIGCKCDLLTSTRVKGGADNIITWFVYRNNIQTNYSDTIFCPVDSTKFYTINY